MITEIVTVNPGGVRREVYEGTPKQAEQHVKDFYGRPRKITRTSSRTRLDTGKEIKIQYVGFTVFIETHEGGGFETMSRQIWGDR